MNNKNNGILTDQEITNTLMSSEWQEKQFSMSIVNIVENNKMQAPQKFENILSNETVKSMVYDYLPEITDQSKIPIDKNENILILKDSFDSFNLVHSVDEHSLVIDEENSSLSRHSFGNISPEAFTCNEILQKTKSVTGTKNKDVIFEDLISDDNKLLEMFKNNHVDEDLKSKKQNNIKDKVFLYSVLRNKETSPNQDSVYSTQITTGEIRVNKTLMQHFNLDGNNYDFDIADSSSTWSFDKPVMAQAIRQNKSRNDVTGKQTSDESTYQAAMKQTMDKTKQSLENVLIEGLHKVSKRYRHDPFKYLGQWLLIQADIRDENIS